MRPVVALRVILQAGLLLFLLWTPSAAAMEADRTLPELRAVYFRAIEDEEAISAGLRMVDSLRVSPRGPADARLDALLRGYRGALITLRAKHGFWPAARLRHLREGLRVLDAAVAARPELAEVRYLRLMSCFYLPPILGRGASVREDFAALARLLPSVRGEYPPELYRSMVRFVLEEGRLSPEQQAPLLGALAALDE